MENLYRELDKVDKQCEEIAGQWNGDESGRMEEMAQTALDIKEKIEELKELIEFMYE